MEGGSSVAQALRVKPTGGLKLKKRLAELEKQVAVFTRLLKYEKDQRASDQSKNKDEIIRLQQELKKAQREVHELSGTKSNSDTAVDNVNELPPLKIYVYEMPEFFNVKQTKINIVFTY